MRSRTSLQRGSDLFPTRVGSGSVVLFMLLISEVASLLIGAETVFYASIVAAWFVLPFVVGPKNVLDAGCLFMLVSLGVVVVVDLARRGQILLLM